MKKLFGIQILSLLILIAVCVPIVCAVQDAVPVDDDFSEKLTVLWNLLVSYVVASLAWAFSGFFKVRDPEQEAFDPVQFFTTLVVGFATGLLAFAIFMATGESLQPSTIVGYLLAIGFVGFVETWVKVLWRRVYPYFKPPEVTTT